MSTKKDGGSGSFITDKNKELFVNFSFRMLKPPEQKRNSNLLMQECSHTSSPGLSPRTALRSSLVPSNTITQFGRQSWFNRDKLGEQEGGGEEGKDRNKKNFYLY